MKKHQFCTDIYDFRSLIQDYLSIADLESVHTKFNFDNILTNVSGRASDQGQFLHKLFYDKMDNDPSFKNLYDSFIKAVVLPIFGEPIIFQKFPTFRVHQPNNICVFEWHKDREFNHDERETNIFMPITKSYDTNTIWAESEDGKEDFSPICADYGEIVSWDGANLTHGNKTNETEQTRISFDFRIMKLKDYDEAEAKESITKKIRFVTGEYFDERVIG